MGLISQIGVSDKVGLHMKACALNTTLLALPRSGLLIGLLLGKGFLSQMTILMKLMLHCL